MALQRATFRRYGAYVLTLAGLSVFLTVLYRQVNFPAVSRLVPGDTISETLPPLQSPQATVRIPCIGPRGLPVQESRDDQVWAEPLDLRRSSGSYCLHTPYG
jgi:hypothetical protein